MAVVLLIGGRPILVEACGRIQVLLEKHRVFNLDFTRDQGSIRYALVRVHKIYNGLHIMTPP